MYLLFAGETYYPSGGWSDFVGAFDSVEDALIRARQTDENGYYFDWFQIVDAASHEIVQEQY